MTRKLPRWTLPAAALLAAACSSSPSRTAEVRIGLQASALPSGITSVRLSVTAADMAPVTADLPLDGTTLRLDVMAGRDRLFTAEAFSRQTVALRGSTAVGELLGGQQTTVSIRLLPVGDSDTTPPGVVSTSPADGATGVATGTLVVAELSEPVDATSVGASSFTLAGPGGSAVAGTVSLSASGTTATFAPLAPLAPATTYAARLTIGLRDLAGNPLGADFTWSFTTSAPGDVTPPSLLGRYSDWIYVPGDAPIELTFSEPLDPATVNGSTFHLRDCSGGAVPAAIANAGAVATLTPSAPLLPYGCYRATVTSEIRDLAGNPLYLGASGAAYTFDWQPTAPPMDAIGSVLPYHTVAAGGAHTLALNPGAAWLPVGDNSGAVYAWGTNHGGALGTGQPIGLQQPTPRAVLLHGSPFLAREVHARSWFSEAADGGGSRPWVWGWGPPIGLNPVDNPAPVAMASAGFLFGLSAGYAHSLLLDASASTGSGYRVQGFGEETGGKLGPPLGSNLPRPIPGLQEDLYRSVAAGGGHSLALRADGTVLAWGDNTYGQLGDGTTAGRSDPRPVSGLTGVAYVSAGDLFSVAVRYDRTVWAWGRNAAGQLGDGTFLDSPVPVQVRTLPPGRVSGSPGVARISAGAGHVLALLQDGTVRAWGHNAGGKLGDGTPVDRSEPVAVSGLASAAEVSAGELHSAARLADGSIWTWGGNGLGQLGDGTTVDSFVPLRVAFDTAPPALLSTSPADGATGVAAGTQVTAAFSEPLDATTVTASSFTLAGPGGTAVAGAVTLSASGTTATFAPLAPLAPFTTYSAALTTAILDRAGHPLAADVPWSFTTGALPDTTPPAVVAVSPATGATGVATGTLVVADFSEPLDPVSLAGSSFTLADPLGFAVPGAVTLSASGVAVTFTPTAPLAPSTTFVGRLTTGLRDLAGNPLAADFTWSFTTAAWTDTTPPTIVAVSPPPDWYPRWIYTPADLPITVTFSEVMDPATLTSSSFLLRDSANNLVPATVSYEGLTATLRPLAPLALNAGYTAYVTTGARDLAGNPLDLTGWVGGSWPVYTGIPPLMGFPPYSPAETIAAGGAHTLAAIGPGVVYAWGTNHGGALGTGQAIGLLQPAPMRIPYVGFYNPTRVYARSWFSEALASTGNLSVWGWGPALGLPAQDNPSPGGGVVPNLVTGLSAGYGHSLALVPSGTGGPLGWAVWGYGDESSGQLGPGTGGNLARSIPGLDQGLYRSVAAGGAHSLALRADGVVLAWGDNRYGQLGDGTTTSRADPQPVPGLTGVAFIAAGDWFSLAVRYDRTVWAWGHNAEGQLGDGTSADSAVPVQVVRLPPVAAVSAGARHALAILTDGTIRAWGHNAGGKLGDGTTTDRSAPVEVMGLADVVEVSAGEFHSAARKADRTIWTWGGNALGQLGDGTTADSHVPLLVPLDVAPPALVSTRPPDGAVDVAVGTAVSATYSEPMDPDGNVGRLWIADAAGNAVDGAFSVAGPVVTFTPARPLAPAATYTATAGFMQDLAGNAAAPASWTFTTAEPLFWSPATPLAAAYLPGVGLPQVGSLAGLDFVVWNDAGTLRGGGTNYPPIAGLALPMVGQPIVLTGPNTFMGYVVYAVDAGGGCPSGDRLEAVGLLIGSEGQTFPTSAPFVLHLASNGCYRGFSAGLLADGIAFAAVDGDGLSAGTISILYDPTAGAWRAGAATSSPLPVDAACSGSTLLVAEGMFGHAQAHSPGSPSTRAVLAVATRPDAATPAAVCASTLDDLGAWSGLSSLWIDATPAPAPPEVTAALDGSGNALVLASRADATGAAFEMTAGYLPAGGGAWEVTALDSSGRAALASAAFDASGNALAAWRPGPATGATPIVAARRDAAAGWGTPVQVSASTGDTRFPRVSVLAGGAGLVLFQSDLPGELRVYAADLQGGAWQAPRLVQDSAVEGRFADTVRCPVGVDLVGRLFAWRETDPTSAGRFRVAVATRLE